MTVYIHPDDRVCNVCYRSHLVIVKHIRKSVISTDSELRDVISELRHSVPSLSEVQSFDQAVSYTVRSLAVSVGEALLKQTAMLLPQLYATFQREVETIVRVQKLTMDQDLRNHTWLRNTLASFLQHHMTYRCAKPKYGTLIYRYGGDLVHSLTVALGQAQSISVGGPIDDDSMLTQVCQTLNSKLHHQINKMISKDSLDPHKIEHFNVDAFISSLDPTIWKTICLLTEITSKKVTYVRKMRMVFALCQIFFTINRQCSFPLHTLITDTIDTCGGSIRLKTILNRLGVCTSAEMHARYVQYRVATRQKEGPLMGLDLHCPVIVSADNLDYQQSFSRVYSKAFQGSIVGISQLVGMVQLYK